MLITKDLIILKDDKEEVLSEICLAVIGIWQGHAGGTFSIDAADIEKMKLNFDKRKLDLVIDYEHQTLSGEIAPAAGWIKELFIKDNALYGRVSWTAKAKEFIKNGEYKYLSPVYDFMGIDEKTGAWQGCTLHSAALTNKPFLDELGEIVANKNFNVKENGMDKNPKIDIGAEAQDATNLSEQIITLKEQLNASKQEVAALSEQLAESAVEGAIVANKLPEGQKQWALSYAKTDLNGFREFLKGVTPPDKKPDLPNNDLFANKNQPQNDIDIVKFALGE
jgi:Mu-like prophage I protein, putative